MSEIRKMLRDLAVIQKLDDEPNDVGGLTAAQLKGKFDEAGLALQDYINNTLIPDIYGVGYSSTSAAVELSVDGWVQEEDGSWSQTAAVPNMTAQAAVVTIALSESATEQQRGEYRGNLFGADQLEGALRVKMYRRPAVVLLLSVGIS